jgi:monofunctional glycosyltransferase
VFFPTRKCSELLAIAATARLLIAADGGAGEPKQRFMAVQTDPAHDQKPKRRRAAKTAASAVADAASRAVASDVEQPIVQEPGMMKRLRVWLMLRWRAIIRRLLTIAAVLVAIPLILTPLYALPFVRPVSTLMLWDLITFQGYTRTWQPIDTISPNLKKSVILSEDGQFCSHYGVDLRELRGVVEDALDGESPRGASTITMQVAKNLFLWNGRSLVRKGLELPLAAYIDLVLSKRRIMEIYLNIAEWGPDNTYGIEAGVQRAFKIDADSMTRRQAALMTVALPNPILRNPAKPSRRMSDVARIIERRAARGDAYVGCVAT